MAQWLGFGSGKCHETRVLDAEASLRRAVEVCRAAGPEERATKAKAVRRLAKRVLSARLRCLKARAVARTVPSADAMAGRQREALSLERRQHELRAQGVEGVLAEFGARDAIA